MRKVVAFLIGGIAAATLTIAAPASAVDLVTNGGFEKAILVAGPCLGQCPFSTHSGL